MAATIPRPRRFASVGRCATIEPPRQSAAGMESIVVMGVAGCGKSSLGLAVARALDRPFVEGDAFHPPTNVEKMRAGTPLADADRWAWLDALGAELARHPDGVVLTCSALKRSYRDRLRAAAPGLRFVHLALGREDAKRRVALRGGHYFKAGLVDSQFDTLEDPRCEAGVLVLDAAGTIDELCASVLAWLGPPP